MSIAAANQLSDPGMVVWIGIAAAAVLIARATGILRVRGVAGPHRVALTESLLPVGMIFLSGAAVWLGVMMILQSLLWYLRGRPQKLEFTAADTAVLATVPAVLAMAALVVGARGMGPHFPARMGFDFKRLPRGILMALPGFALVLPMVIAVSVAMQVFYQWIAYKHPMEHELLKELGTATSPFIRAVLIFSAVVIAPIMEEFLFRGYLQTILRMALTRVSLAPGTPNPLSASPATPPEPEKAAWPAWVAILITSACFALVHPVWSIPAILVLSVCLGYAYERTGNLWTCVFLHAMFNGSQVLQFMTVRAQH